MKLETIKHQIERACTDLLVGKRRPCCWAGCLHRWFYDECRVCKNRIKIVI